jgi:DNA-binding MarR family transcriptional regulator
MGAKSSAIDNSPLEWADVGQLCYGLAFASRSLHNATAEITEVYDLGPRGGWILNLIEVGQIFPRDLAAMFKVGRSLITAELVRLTAAELITTRPGESDRRKTELMLTAKGQAAADQIRAAMMEIVTHRLAAYAPAQIRLLTQMLLDARGDVDMSVVPDKP